MSKNRLRLKPGREKSIHNRHPWIFSGAVADEPFDAPPGEIVDVFDATGDFLGRGAYNTNSQIRVRMFTFRDEEIDVGWFAARLREADHWRRAMLPPDTDSYRVLHAEGDGVPGLIVDRYGEGLVISLSTAGADQLRDVIAEAAQDVLQPAWMLERSVGGYRREEGLDDRIDMLFGETPPQPLRIRENGLSFLVDVQGGQKTGFFLDQRESRAGVRASAADKTMLNAFGYTGGFAVYALAGGASRAVTVDASGDALALARQNHEINDQHVQPEDLVCRDVFNFLREDETEFDLIVLDPPAFAKSKASVNRAARGYKDINMLAMRRIVPGGMLWTFSCSGHVPLSLHRKILFSAAIDAGRQVQILHTLGHSFDHPINVYHPEGEYLTGFVCRVTD